MRSITDIWSFQLRMFEINHDFIIGPTKGSHVIIFNDFVFTMTLGHFSMAQTPTSRPIIETSDYGEYFRLVHRLIQEWLEIQYIEEDLEYINGKS